MDDKLYAELIESLKSFAIQLQYLNMTLHNDDFGDQNVSVKMVPKVKDHSIEKIVIDVEFHVESKLADTDKTSFDLAFTFRMTYELNGDFEPSIDLVKQLIARNVPINLWPYARELISSLTVRMGLHPLFLEPLQIRL